MGKGHRERTRQHTSNTPSRLKRWSTHTRALSVFGMRIRDARETRDGARQARGRWRGEAHKPAVYSNVTRKHVTRCVAAYVLQRPLCVERPATPAQPAQLAAQGLRTAVAATAACGVVAVAAITTAAMKVMTIAKFTEKLYSMPFQNNEC